MAEFLVIVCSRCGAKINAPPQFIGKRIKCPKCANPVEVVDPNEPLVPLHDEEDLPPLPPEEGAAPDAGAPGANAPKKERTTRFRRKGTASQAAVRARRGETAPRGAREESGARGGRMALAPQKKSSAGLIIGIVVALVAAGVLYMARAGSGKTSGGGGGKTTGPSKAQVSPEEQANFDAWLRRYAAYHVVNAAFYKRDILQARKEKEPDLREAWGALNEALQSLDPNPFTDAPGEEAAWRKKGEEGKISLSSLDAFCNATGAEGRQAKQGGYAPAFTDRISPDLNSADKAQSLAGEFLSGR